MPFLELARKRQSCRRYSDRPVDKAALDRCFEAARLAPSSCNTQPWSCVAVTDLAVLAQRRAAVFNGPYSMCAFAKDAPVLVALVAQPSVSFSVWGGLWRGVRFNWLDLGIVGEHFVLQAQEESLSTCWLGWFNEKRFKKIAGIPRSKKIAALFSVGYAHPDDRLREKNRKSLENVRRYL